MHLGGGGYANVYCRGYVPVHGLRGGSSTCGRGGGQEVGEAGYPWTFLWGPGGGGWSRRQGGGPGGTEGRCAAPSCPRPKPPSTAVPPEQRPTAPHVPGPRPQPPGPPVRPVAGAVGAVHGPLPPGSSWARSGGGGGGCTTRAPGVKRRSCTSWGWGGGGLGDRAPSPTLMGRAPKGCMAPVPKNLLKKIREIFKKKFKNIQKDLQKKFP